MCCAGAGGVKMDDAAGGKYRSLQHDQLGELLSAASLHHCYLDVLIHRLKVTSYTHTHTHNHLTALCPGLPG